jgi:hypothetical protein
MPVDPEEFGDMDFGHQGDVFDPRISTTVNDPATDFGRQGVPHPVVTLEEPPATGGGGTVIFFLSL